jgi:hypothetical protein
MSPRTRKLLSVPLLLILTLNTGCDNAAFREQIGEFQKAMSESRTGVEAYYQEMNQFEMDLYLLSREIDASQDLAFTYAPLDATQQRPAANPKAGYVNGPFPPASVQARLDALKLIGVYGQRLAELAGTDAPAVFENQTMALGANLVNLGSTFEKLSVSGDKSALSYAKPISALVGVVGRLFLERKRDKDLVEAIKTATPQITIITTQLKADLEDVISPVRRTGLEASIALLTEHYNDEREKPASTRKARKELLGEVRGVIRQYELLTIAKPQQAVESMEEANQALLAYASSDRKNADFIQLVGKISEFRDRAKQIVQAVQEIREIRKEMNDADGQ